MQESIGTTQVHEVHLTKEEITKIVIANIKERGPVGYDFDKLNPIVLWTNGAIKLRYVQKAITEEVAPRGFALRPMPTVDDDPPPLKKKMRPQDEDDDM